jgi:hypothetical protein
VVETENEFLECELTHFANGFKDCWKKRARIRMGDIGHTSLYFNRAVCVCSCLSPSPPFPIVVSRTGVRLSNLISTRVIWCPCCIRSLCFDARVKRVHEQREHVAPLRARGTAVSAWYCCGTAISAMTGVCALIFRHEAMLEWQHGLEGGAAAAPVSARLLSSWLAVPQQETAVANFLQEQEQSAEQGDAEEYQLNKLGLQWNCSACSCVSPSHFCLQLCFTSGEPLAAFLTLELHQLLRVRGERRRLLRLL